MTQNSAADQLPSLDDAKHLAKLSKDAFIEMLKLSWKTIKDYAKKMPDILKLVKKFNNIIKSIGEKINVAFDKIKNLISKYQNVVTEADIPQDTKTGFFGNIKRIIKRIFRIYIFKSLSDLIDIIKKEFKTMTIPKFIKLAIMGIVAGGVIYYLNTGTYRIIKFLFPPLGKIGSLLITSTMIAPLTEEIGKLYMNKFGKSVLPATGVFLGEFAMYMNRFSGRGVVELIKLFIARVIGFSFHSETIVDNAKHGDKNIRENITMHALFNGFLGGVTYLIIHLGTKLVGLAF